MVMSDIIPRIPAVSGNCTLPTALWVIATDRDETASSGLAYINLETGETAMLPPPPSAPQSSTLSPQNETQQEDVSMDDKQVSSLAGKQ